MAASPFMETNMATYLVSGFFRKDKKHVCIVLQDPFKDDAFAAAEVFNPANIICFTSSTNIFAVVPDELMFRPVSPDELYARVPELNPKQKRHRRSQGRRLSHAGEDDMSKVTNAGMIFRGFDIQIHCAEGQWTADCDDGKHRCSVGPFPSEREAEEAARQKVNDLKAAK
jgi:hypothetical protein